MKFICKYNGMNLVRFDHEEEKRYGFSGILLKVYPLSEEAKRLDWLDKLRLEDGEQMLTLQGLLLCLMESFGGIHEEVAPSVRRILNDR